MTFFSEFNKLHFSVKTVFISVLCVIPFYFVSIYLFQENLIIPFKGKYFYLNEFDVIYIFCVCFVLSLTWVISNIFLSVGINSIAEKILKEETDIEIPFILTFIYSIGYLSSSILVNYYFVNASLLNFVMLSHLFLLIRYLWSFCYYHYLRIFDKL